MGYFGIVWCDERNGGNMTRVRDVTNVFRKCFWFWCGQQRLLGGILALHYITEQKLHRINRGGCNRATEQTDGRQQIRDGHLDKVGIGSQDFQHWTYNIYSDM